MKRHPETISFWQGRLPHWEVVDGRYFVTIHLSGAIPAAGKQRIHDISDELQVLSRASNESRLRVQRQVFREMEKWLDSAERNLHLQDRQVASALVEAIEHRSQVKTWQMFEYVVMPNHVHLFFELLEGSLKDVLETFKEWTGRQAGKIFDLKGKRFWQREWFDHWSRSDEEDERIVEYIRRNPVKVGLVSDYVEWPYGSWSANTPRGKFASASHVFHRRGPAGPAGPTS